MSQHAAQLTDHAALLRFALAGNARLTLVSERTSTRFTFQLRASENDAVRFVSVLTGADNEADFSFLGTIFVDGLGYRYSLRSSLQHDVPSARAWAWFWRHIAAGRMAPNCEVWHEGRCGRCGRALTVPQSIATGLGPECAKPRLAKTGPAVFAAEVAA